MTQPSEAVDDTLGADGVTRAERTPLSVDAAWVALLIVLALCARGLVTHLADASPHVSHGRPERVGHETPQTPAAALRDGQALDLNRASADELRLLPGIGPKLANKIIEERVRLGRFTHLRQLDAISGIGSKKLSTIAPLVSFGAEACDAIRSRRANRRRA